MTLPQTPFQTIGPYFAMLIARTDAGEAMADERTPGQPIQLVGRILDGTGHHIEDALVEVWQADAAGRYRHPFDDDRPPTEGGFTGFGRSKGRFQDGVWRFRTIRPGAVPGPDGTTQAPHLNLCVFGRGMTNGVFTRVYFPEDAEAQAADPVLAAVPADRRSTLVARRGATMDGVTTYVFDVVVQGPGETVFLDF